MPSTNVPAADVCLWRNFSAQAHCHALSAQPCMLAQPRRWTCSPAQAVKQRPPCSEVPRCTCVDGGHGDRSAAGAREAAGLRILAALQQQVLAHRALGHSPHHWFLAGLQGASHHSFACHKQHLYSAGAACSPAVQAARPPSMSPLRSSPCRHKTYQHLPACLCTFCFVCRPASCNSRPWNSQAAPLTEAACASSLQLLPLDTTIDSFQAVDLALPQEMVEGVALFKVRLCIFWRPAQASLPTQLIRPSLRSCTANCGATSVCPLKCMTALLGYLGFRVSVSIGGLELAASLLCESFKVVCRSFMRRR